MSVISHSLRGVGLGLIVNVFTSCLQCESERDTEISLKRQSRCRKISPRPYAMIERGDNDQIFALKQSLHSQAGASPPSFPSVGCQPVSQWLRGKLTENLPFLLSVQSHPHPSPYTSHLPIPITLALHPHDAVALPTRLRHLLSNVEGATYAKHHPTLFSDLQLMDMRISLLASFRRARLVLQLASSCGIAVLAERSWVMDREGDEGVLNRPDEGRYHYCVGEA